MKYERLTARDKNNGKPFIPYKDYRTDEKINGYDDGYFDLLNRLAELEDKIERGELVENKVVTYINMARSDSKTLIDKAIKYDKLKNKIENGTLVELPIPNETELHFLYSREHYGKPQPPCVYSTKEWIFNIRYDGKRWFCVAGQGIGYYGEYLHELGKTVFLTKAEAEQKLKELL